MKTTFIKVKNAGTSGLIRHLESQHKMIYRKKTSNISSNTEPQVDQIGPSVKKHKLQMPISEWFNVEKETIQSVVSELVAKDGITFNQIMKSRWIQKMMRSDKLNPPKSLNTLVKYTNDEADKVRAQIIATITALIATGNKFSTSVDEQTTASNFRILNVQLYTEEGTSFNLGMVPIKVGCPAEKMVELTNGRLEEFAVDPVRDVIASTTDGAEVCKRYGRLLTSIHQLCYDHGVHLAVVKVIYKKAEDYRKSVKAINLGVDAGSDIDGLLFEIYAF